MMCVKRDTYLRPRRHHWTGMPALRVEQARFGGRVKEAKSRLSGIELVPGGRVELPWCCHRRILSPLRLPFRHPGLEGGLYQNDQ